MGYATESGGTWSFATPSLTSTAHSFSARIEDLAGNSGLSGNTYAVTVDVALPAATASITGAADDAGTVTGNVATGGSSDDTSLTLSGAITGTLGTGSVVLYDGAARLGAATVTGTTWSFAASGLTEGPHSFKAVVESDQGNQGAASTTYQVTVDATAPGAPTISPNIAGNDVINSAEKTAGVLVSGNAEANATIVLDINGTTRSTTAGANGLWSINLTSSDISTIGDGASLSISATARDAAGNLGAVSSARTIAIDTTAPGVPAFIDVTAGNVVIASEVGTAVVSGTAETGSTVLLNIGGNLRELSTTGVDWTYTFTQAEVDALGQGSVSVSASARDAAGNTGSSASKSFTIDISTNSVPTCRTKPWQRLVKLSN